MWNSQSLEGNKLSCIPGSRFTKLQVFFMRLENFIFTAVGASVFSLHLYIHEYVFCSPLIKQVGYEIFHFLFELQF